MFLPVFDNSAHMLQRPSSSECTDATPADVMATPLPREPRARLARTLHPVWYLFTKLQLEVSLSGSLAPAKGAKMVRAEHPRGPCMSCLLPHQGLAALLVCAETVRRCVMCCNVLGKLELTKADGVQDQPKLAIVMKVIGRTGSRGQVCLLFENWPLVFSRFTGCACGGVSAGQPWTSQRRSAAAMPAYLHSHPI